MNLANLFETASNHII